MTKKEKTEAASIMKRYQRINEKIENILDTLEKVNMRKDSAMKELEDVKRMELDFMSRYTEKYGKNRNILVDLQNPTE